MFNKNDPLIDSVKGVMQQNQAHREAVRAVNETFKVTDKRQLSYEDQLKYDAAVAQKLQEAAELSPKQKKLAAVAGDPKKIDAADLAAARKGHASHIEEDAEDTEKSVKAAADVQNSGMPCKNDYEMESPKAPIEKPMGSRPADKTMTEGKMKDIATAMAEKKRLEKMKEMKEADEAGENLPPVEPKAMGQRVNTAPKADRLDAAPKNTTVIPKNNMQEGRGKKVVSDILAKMRAKAAKE
jgi:hypothetical protein